MIDAWGRNDDMGTVVQRLGFFKAIFTDASEKYASKIHQLIRDIEGEGIESHELRSAFFGGYLTKWFADHPKVSISFVEDGR